MKKLNPSKVTKSSIILSAVSYPIAYFCAIVFYKITYFLNFFIPSLFPTIDTKACILSLVISINVISMLRVLGTKSSNTDQQ